MNTVHHVNYKENHRRNIPSIKHTNKKPRIPNFTTDPSLFFFFFFFPICKKNQYPFIFLLFSPQLLLFSSVLRYVFFSFLLNFFLISILSEFIFFAILSFTCNYINVRLFFFVFFSLYLLFYFIFIFFVLNNCMNVVVGFVFQYI